MNWRVQFAPEALDQRQNDTLIRSSISCMKLQTFPARGVARDDLLPRGRGQERLTEWANVD
jgi:hypothetical protein